jgi:glutamate racemase
MKELLETYLEPMIEAKIDYLVLGCSHYPYLVPQISKILPEGVKIIDSGEAVARQTKKVLEEYNILNTSKEKGYHVFYTNGNPAVLDSILGQQYKAIQKDF